MTTEVTNRYRDSRYAPGQNVTEVVKATVDTDGSGNGSLTGIALSEEFGDAPVAVMGEGSDAAATVANVTADSFDITVSGSSTVSGTVNVNVVLVGGRR